MGNQLATIHFLIFCVSGAHLAEVKEPGITRIYPEIEAVGAGDSPSDELMFSLRKIDSNAETFINEIVYQTDNTCTPQRSSGIEVAHSGALSASLSLIDATGQLLETHYINPVDDGLKHFTVLIFASESVPNVGAAQLSSVGLTVSFISWGSEQPIIYLSEVSTVVRSIPLVQGDQLALSNKESISIGWLQGDFEWHHNPVGSNTCSLGQANVNQYFTDSRTSTTTPATTLSSTTSTSVSSLPNHINPTAESFVNEIVYRVTSCGEQDSSAIEVAYSGDESIVVQLFDSAGTIQSSIVASGETRHKAFEVLYGVASVGACRVYRIGTNETLSLVSWGSDVAMIIDDEEAVLIYNSPLRRGQSLMLVNVDQQPAWYQGQYVWRNDFTDRCSLGQANPGQSFDPDAPIPSEEPPIENDNHFNHYADNFINEIIYMNSGCDGSSEMVTGIEVAISNVINMNRLTLYDSRGVETQNYTIPSAGNNSTKEFPVEQTSLDNRATETPTIMIDVDPSVIITTTGGARLELISMEEDEEDVTVSFVSWGSQDPLFVNGDVSTVIHTTPMQEGVGIAMQDALLNQVNGTGGWQQGHFNWVSSDTNQCSLGRANPFQTFNPLAIPPLGGPSTSTTTRPLNIIGQATSLTQSHSSFTLIPVCLGLGLIGH
eukprot:GHVN01081146.1.p1 GENE.GHVN01081146.1~~GHVN01081146.1.p1  ORF type:complete len:659 (+),score=114.87 GHVN01081146.1:408-2384(+)